MVSCQTNVKMRMQTDAKSYGLISLTSNISKIAERITSVKLITFLQETYLLNDTQNSLPPAPTAILLGVIAVTR